MRYLERNFASIFLMHFSGFLSMSCSHSLRTDHPSRLSFRVYLLSRLMLFSILSRQNFFASLFFWLYLYPCQKSPSQKITILFLLCAKSGLPYICGCISNLYPVSSSIFLILSSIFVSLPLICDMTHDLFSGVKMSAIFRFMDSAYTNQFCQVASKMCRTFFHQIRNNSSNKESRGLLLVSSFLSILNDSDVTGGVNFAA